MKDFLRKTGIALLMALGLHALFGFFADGTTDDMYLRFASGRQRSLILGGSRAAQGLIPEVFNDRSLGAPFEGPLFNYAFTIAHSPYGPTYLHAIEEKLDATARNGLFILEVDPWLLAWGADVDRNSLPQPLGEETRALGEQWDFNSSPNYEYLLRHWTRGWGALSHWPRRDEADSTELLPNGRLRTTVTMAPALIEVRTQRKLKYYGNHLLPNMIVSKARLENLVRTIELLKRHGTVVLVRLPVCSRLLAIEARLSPDFDRRLATIAVHEQVRYLNYTTLADSVGYTDGNHMDEMSGWIISKRILAETLAERR